MSTKVEVWGPLACFSRPELKVERMSYDVMTPSAARGILDAIYWHPGLRWVVSRIWVLNPISFTNIRRNEVKSKVSAANVRSVMNGGGGELYINTSDDIQQRASAVLRDVRYIIEARFQLTDQAAPGDNEGKFCSIMNSRLQRGQCYHQPYFGCREFPAQFRQWAGDMPAVTHADRNRNLGLMLYDMDYTDPENMTPMFFQATLQNGILTVPPPDSREVLR